MSPLEDKMVTCTVGELLVQLRLLECDVQAASPLKDSGDDLIAIRGRQFRAIQVKATRDAKSFSFDQKELQERSYHVPALVRLVGENSRLALDDCRIYLVPKEAVRKGYYRPEKLAECELTGTLVDTFFGEK
ncbi:MAG TPA: hypothetical protein VGS20_14795 [Candidatus Acidoferrales bacterium]|nr:hypothetical protein [Candidatus Acidoferrales bacterium]